VVTVSQSPKLRGGWDRGRLPPTLLRKVDG
jgi:hypothetical protein